MKESVGEGSLTVVTIVAIAALAAIGIAIVSFTLSKTRSNSNKIGKSNVNLTKEYDNLNDALIDVHRQQNSQ